MKNTLIAGFSISILATITSVTLGIIAAFFIPPLSKIFLFIIAIVIFFVSAAYCLIKGQLTPHFIRLVFFQIPLFFAAYFLCRDNIILAHAASLVEYKFRQNEFKSQALLSQSLGQTDIEFLPWNDSAFSNRVFIFTANKIKEGASINFSQRPCPVTAFKLDEGFYVLLDKCTF